MAEPRGMTVTQPTSSNLLANPLVCTAREIDFFSKIPHDVIDDVAEMLSDKLAGLYGLPADSCWGEKAKCTGAYCEFSVFVAQKDEPDSDGDFEVGYCFTKVIFKNRSSEIFVRTDIYCDH